MVAQVIEIKDAQNWQWGNNNVTFRGILPGYVCGLCLQVEKDGRVDYCSTTFTNDLDICSDYSDLGISADLASMNGAVPTGKVVFRGYYEEEYDWQEREEYYLDKTQEAERTWDKYVVA